MRRDAIAVRHSQPHRVVSARRARVPFNDRQLRPRRDERRAAPYGMSSGVNACFSGAALSALSPKIRLIAANNPYNIKFITITRFMCSLQLDSILSTIHPTEQSFHCSHITFTYF